MKRLSVFILSLVYLAAITGVSVNLHFCMEELADLSLWTKSQQKTCGKCGMEKHEEPNGCCKDEHKWVKVQDDQKASVASFQLSQLQPAEPIQITSYNVAPFISETEDLLPNSHAPPRSCSIGIYKRNCVFLI